MYHNSLSSTLAEINSLVFFKHPTVKSQDERCVGGVTLRTVPAGSPTSPIKARKSVVTANVLPGPSDTFRINLLIRFFLRALTHFYVPRGTLF